MKASGRKKIEILYSHPSHKSVGYPFVQQDQLGGEVKGTEYTGLAFKIDKRFIVELLEIENL